MADGPLAPCTHVWVANSGRGGDPVFKPARQMSTVPIMHVTCRTCGTRTWFTEAQWNTLPHHPNAKLDRAFPHNKVPPS